MVRRILAKPVSSARVAVIDTQWNEFIVSRLTEGAIHTLEKAEASIDHITVPGAFELPLAAKTAAETGRYEAIIVLGCVIRGATPHFDYVAGEAAGGISAASRETGIPMAFGVLTTESIEQAIERAGTKLGNKGTEAATVALEMMGLMSALRKGGEA